VGCGGNGSVGAEGDMPTELVAIGGILVVAVGVGVFFLMRRHKSEEPPHFR